MQTKKVKPGQSVDIVYVLGKGSKWKNNEIRYSLRSVERNLIGYRNIYIVGEDPGFLQGIIHIQHPDEIGAQNADGNIARKVLRACMEENLSENFLFINDDHLILQKMDVSNIPNFHKGDMLNYPKNHWNSNLWRKRLKRTCDMLKARNMTTYNFDCHTPMLFNKRRFPEVMEMFDYADDIGYTMKSMYGNVEYAKDCTLITNEKRTVFMNYRADQIENRLHNCSFMSFNDEGLNAHLKKWLWSKFPVRSKWEINNVEDFYTEILIWMNDSRNYAEGTRLFAKYISRHNINKLFSTGETPALREKLEYKLQIIINDYER